MKKKHPGIVSSLLIAFFFTTTVGAQAPKTHTEKFAVNENVEIHLNTSHTNVKIETWDRNEVEVTFKLEADEKVEEYFKNWNFEATGEKNTVNIESQHSFSFDFDMGDFDFNFDVGELDMNMENFNIDMSELNIDIENMVSDVMDGLDLDAIPPSPFGEGANFNGNEYDENPDAYLKKYNAEHGTQITRQEVDQWIEDIEEWAENIEVRIESKNFDFSELEKQIEAQTKDIEKSVEIWTKENEEKIKEMTERIEKQMENIDFEQFEQFENFNHFDQDNSKVKKSIHIKMPKNAKLHMDVRYGEVTLAQVMQNVNADLNYASLSANTISGASTDISASYAPVFINYWNSGQLELNHCSDILIKKIDQIKLNAQGTDVTIGTLLSSGIIHSTYGDLEIQNLGTQLDNLNLAVDFGSAYINLSSSPLNLKYTGDRNSKLSIPDKIKILSDKTEGKFRLLNAYNQNQNSGNVLSVLANYGDLVIK